MSVEEIIAVLSQMAKRLEGAIMHPWRCDFKRNEIVAIREAIALLKTHPEFQPNEPLSFEEIRELDGQPVWVRNKFGDSVLGPHGWAIVVVQDSEHILLDFFHGDSLLLIPAEFEDVEDEEDEVVGIYRSKPEEAMSDGKN